MTGIAFLAFIIGFPVGIAIAHRIDKPKPKRIKAEKLGRVSRKGRML